MNTPFQLDQAISLWRAELNESGSIGSAALAELETHLRDSFEELRTPALSDDEAFHIARRRLGGAEIVEEFAKVDPAAVWAGRARWMIFGVLGSQIFWSGSKIAMLLTQTMIAISTNRFGWGGPVIALALGQGLMGLLTMGLFAYILIGLVRGKWRLENSKWISFLRHPAVLAVVVCLFVALQTMTGSLCFRFLGPVIYFNVALVQTYVQMTITLVTPVILAAALIMAQRRARQVS